MSNQIYNWKRFWCKRNGKYSLADGGYLYDPDSRYGNIYNSEALPFETILETPCLVLLGEPGIGKTTAMESQKEFVEFQVSESGNSVLWVNLGAYQTDLMLYKAIFENEIFKTWIKGDYVLNLFLDSLDESLLRIDTITIFLVEEIKKFPCERLKLVIACRTADWSINFEEGLKAIWGKDKFGAYELLPLRRIDVIEAINANDINTEALLSEIDSKCVVPFAIKPVTLQFLINIYKKGGCLPNEQKDIYVQGCTTLCEEINVGHSGANINKSKGTLTKEQRVSIAARIAAVTIFTNRYAIWSSIDHGNIPDTDVVIKELIANNCFNCNVEINENTIMETLNTGLFTSRGANRMGWAHQTYAEFLAAYYLKTNGVSLVQIESLIIHPNNLEKRVVPQLREVAAWLASMVPGILNLIMKNDPEVLLLSDIATKDDKIKKDLVESLLILFDEDKLIDDDYNLRKRYKNLYHSQLASQLKPYIENTQKNIFARRVAINIAIECGVEDLQESLVVIALNSSDEINVRKCAARALCEIGNKETKKKLKQLLISAVEQDIDDDLRGYSLIAAWPNCMAAKELFNALTPPKKDSYIGVYFMFLHSDIVKDLQVEDLKYALKWVKEQPSVYEVDSLFGELKDEIILKAFEFIDKDEILHIFVETILPSLKRGYPIICDKMRINQFNLDLSINKLKRHRIIEAIIPFLESSEKEYYCLKNWETPLVICDDISWLIEKLNEEINEKYQWVWAHLISVIYDVKNSTSTEIIYEATKTNIILQKVFAPYFEPIELSSEKANELKAVYMKMNEEIKFNQKEVQLVPPPKERIEFLLNVFESGDFNAWWRLNSELTLVPESIYYGDELESNITLLYGWINANEETKNRIVDAAKKYIVEQDPNTVEWFGKNNLYFPAFAGYRAFLLLLQVEEKFLNMLSIDIWKKWASIILAYPISYGIHDNSIHQRIVSIAYKQAPCEIIKYLILMIDEENKTSNHIFIIFKVTTCWDEHIEKALLEKIFDPELKPECMGELLNALLENGNVVAKEFAKEFIKKSICNSQTQRQRAVIALSEFFYYSTVEEWTVIIWPSIIKDTEFALQVIKRVATELDRHSKIFMMNLNEEQLGDLYIWLVHQFPYSEDPVHENGHWVDEIDSVIDLRDSILNYLKNKGTVEACKIIEKIAIELPELNFIKWILLEATKNMRRQTWIPYKPDEILRIVTNRDSRLVDDGEQLVTIIIESLERLELKLQGVTPAAIDLWNVKPNRPKDENCFSDYVKRHLEDDLKNREIIINREVEIRRGVGSGTGERTDIYVNAFTEKSDMITVIIEAKGCWHPELDTALTNQLVGRYLKDNPSQYGVYLVGWFNSEFWDDNDPRKKSAHKRDMNEAKEKYDAQATEISENGIYVKAFVMNAAIR